MEEVMVIHAFDFHLATQFEFEQAQMLVAHNQ
jgi:hypothetical protein